MANAQADFVARATDYAKTLAADKVRQHGKWARLAAVRFLRDMDRAGKPGCPFVFDEWRANDACQFLERLPHVEGEWKTPTIELHPAHIFATVNIFGFRTPEGGRRFTSALWASARKNAKSTWAAGVLLYCQLCEDESGPQVISAATTGSQARIVFNVAKRMVEKLPALREAFGVQSFAHAIASIPNGGTFKPINAKASTQDGLNPSAVCLDEVHAHKSHDLLNVLKSAAGARRNPLFLYTTTEGYETPGPWPELRRFVQQVLEEVVEANHFFGVIYALDDKDEDFAEDDDFDPAVWSKANPLMDVNPILAREIAKEAIEAKQMPGKLAEFRIKRLNRQAATATGFINLAKWRACSGVVLLDDLVGKPCWAGLDLASTSDLTSLRLVWRDGDKWITWGRRWVPAEQVRQRAQRGTVDYAGWVAAGWVEQTEGEVVDYEVIERELNELRERFDIKLLAYDSWNARDLVNRLQKADWPLAAFIQGPKSYHPAMQELERAYTSGKLAHGGDPVLQWCASNLVARTDENNNMAPSKKRSADKIDDMSALLMAIGACISEQPVDTNITEGFIEL